MRVSTWEAALPGRGQAFVRPLFGRFPHLVEPIPCLNLAQLPTPVHRLNALGRALNAGDIWIKRDDRSGTLYGGNKPRKLEFLLAHALAAGARRVVTFGTLGNHHGLATALYARELGLQVRLVLRNQSPTDDGRRQLLILKQLGVDLIHTPSAAAYFQAMMRQHLQRDPWTYVIPAGGSSAIGTLGFVNAALELAEQVRLGQMPAPDYIFLPAGTGGTMAGLEIGLRLAGLPTTVVGVRVTDKITCNPWIVSGLAKRTAQFLKNAGARLPRLGISALQVCLLDGYLGRGYGVPSTEGERALNLMRECEGLSLDSTYTAKALAGMMGFMAAEGLQGRTILYWNTGNALPLPQVNPVTRDTASPPKLAIMGIAENELKLYGSL